MKVCALYGAGFYYIPGTDTCLKIGGFVRADYAANAGGSHGQYWDGGNAANNRYSHDFQTRVRWNMTLDARTQTEYGTLRSYIRAGMQYSTVNGTSIDGQIYYDRAFIQLGGFTFGKTLSFYDAFSGGFASYTTLAGASDTGNGTNVAAYTAQFGNGFTGTISIEDAVMRRAGIYSNLDTDYRPGLALTSRYGGQQVPDIVGNLRVDQAWGTAQLSAALQQVRATYYGAGAPLTYLEGNGYPEDKWGFAVQGALQFKLPWAAGDAFTVQAGYSEGATAYVFGNSNGKSNLGVYHGTEVFSGMLVDGVYGAAGSDLQLTKIFGVNAGLEHYWTPTLRSSVFGSYVSVDFNDTASGLICASSPFLSPAGAVQAGCNPDWNMYQVGTRTVWNPVRNLDVGLELLYTKFETDAGGSTMQLTGTTMTNVGKPATTYTVADQDVFSGMIRVQRNFWP
ncbi:porin [Xanthobacteraceae bacterium Astr-EGSB]|uniref:porin n=1 Tax=Astrobacterium formosum TaxID=3069710 RepID=UPI0027B1020E|nr:porin [Xanthobacteraceae bacterium Astr-EGSB]